MAFDEVNFRKLAKEANYSDDEIDSYIAKQSTANTATGQEFGTAAEKDIQQKAQELRDAGSPVPGTQEPKTEQSTLSKMFDFVKTPAGTAAATGAAIGLGELARKGLASRKTATPEVMPQIEPTFTPPTAPAIEAPKAPAFTGNAQPTAMPVQQPYGATTINAPTGVPGPAIPPSGAAPQPVAPVAPAPVDPIQAARIRKAEAEAAIAEHKLQQLQAGPKTVASGKAATPGYSEAEMKMVQQGGAASASKALEAQKIAGSVAPKPDPIAATATPAEKASAVAVVEETPKTSSGMREQYHKSKKNPIGPGGFNWLSGQEGPNAQQLWEEVYGKKNVPYEQVVSDYSKAKVGPQIPRESGKPGGSFEKPKEIPEYIKGSASIPALLSLAGNALGGVAIAKEVKEAKKTGDWSNVGLDVIGQILGNIAPKASLGLSLMAPGTLGAEEMQQLEKRRKKSPTIDGAAVPR